MVVLGLLAQREHARLELQLKLQLRRFSPETIALVLNQLAEENCQSDVRYAEVYARSRIAKGYGPVKIMAGLRAGGVDDCTIADTLKSYADEWAALALQVYKRKFGNTAFSRQDQREKAKRIRFMQSRGFAGASLKNIFQITDDEIEQYDQQQ